MPESVEDRIVHTIAQCAALYHRLMVVAGPSGSGKTRALKSVHERTKTPLINVNLELSRRMLDLTERQRALQVARLLDETIQAVEGETVLLDNTEILFHPSLKQEPLRLLQTVSRNRTVIVTWNGKIEGDQLIYAEPGHPEHRSHRIQDFLAVSTS